MRQTRLSCGHRIDILTKQDFGAAYRAINDAASAYSGVIPDDCWHEPYMPRGELAEEIAAGVVFLGYWVDTKLVGVMGMQAVQDVTLIRHAYVLNQCQRKGFGSALLREIIGAARWPLLVGTWAAARWAIDFYRRHGFEQVEGDAGIQLLRRYWRIGERQIETSVVLRLVSGEKIPPENGWKDVR